MIEREREREREREGAKVVVGRINRASRARVLSFPGTERGGEGARHDGRPIRGIACAQTRES